MEIEEKSHTNKKLVRNLAIALLSSFSIVAVILIFSKGENTLTRISEFPLYELILDFAIFSLIFLIDSIRTMVISHFLGEKVNLRVALNNSILGYFFTYITPFSAGGQPYQIYHLTKWGVSAENSSAIILTRWSNMLIFLSFSSLFLMKNYLPLVQFGIPLVNRILGIVIVVSVAFSLAMVTFFLIPTVGIGIVRWVKGLKFVKFIFKLFKKDSEEVLENFSERMKKFYKSMRIIWAKKPWLVIFDGFMGVLDLFVLYYVLYRSIEISSVAIAPFRLSFWNLSAIYILMSFIVYYVPTPGSSGGIEGGFYAVLSTYGSKPAVMTGILMWRFTTYYLPILLGFVFMIFEVRKNPKSASS